MNHVTKCKIVYGIYSIPMTIWLKMKGVQVNFLYSGGLMYVAKSKGSIVKIGEKCRFMSKSWGNPIGINHRCMICAAENAQIIIGKMCSFSGVSIRCHRSIILGNYVRVGANALIMDGDGHANDPRSNGSKPIVIEDHVWIGTNVMILKGVRIGKNSVIGAGSIVTKDIPANSVAVGNPCRVVKVLKDDIVNNLEGLKN